jgi:glycosyltransferase involved in cell wall biosynthesis
VTERPLVSVVTPTLNQGRFIEATIRSIRAQGYDRFEHIVVDGGSTDGSADIIERYADQLTSWTSEPDAGQADALNKGFARAKGDLIGWLNSDDTLLPGTISTVVERFERDRELLLVYGDAMYIDESSRRTGYFPADDLVVPEMLRTCKDNIVQQGSFFSRRAWEIAGPLHGYYCLDFEFVLRIGLAGRVERLERPLATYRLHADSKSMSGSVATARGEDYLRMYDTFFARDDLPSEVAAVETEGRAQAELWAGENFYLGLDMRRARRSYLRALRRDPSRISPRTLSLVARTFLPRPLVSGLRSLRG